MLDLAAIQFENAGRVFVCAWCQQERGVAVADLPPNSSHGICPRHKREFLAGIGNLKHQVPTFSGSSSGSTADPVPA
jgi:hypothetical protein